MKQLSTIIAAIGVLAAVASAHAGVDHEREAKQLFLDGNRKLKSGDYRGAVVKYRAAYARVANPKILHNLAITLTLLGRNVEAADVYEQYLVNPRHNPHRVAAIEKSLRALESKIGRISVEVDQPGARVSLDGTVLGRSPKPMFRRVEPGRHVLTATKRGYRPARAQLEIIAGQVRAVRFHLVRVGIAARPPVPAPLPVITANRSRRGKLGVYVRTDIDGNSLGRGGVVTAAVAYNAGERLQLAAGAIVSATPGVYAGMTWSLTTGRVRPQLLAGMPIQFSDQGTMLGVHAAAAIHISLTRTVGALVGVGVEHFLTIPPGVEPTVFVPSLGLTWRL